MIKNSVSYSDRLNISIWSLIHFFAFFLLNFIFWHTVGIYFINGIMSDVFYATLFWPMGCLIGSTHQPIEDSTFNWPEKWNILWNQMLSPKFCSLFSDFYPVKIPFELFRCPEKTINMWAICKMNITFMKHRFGFSVIIARSVIVFDSGAEFILFKGSAPSRNIELNRAGTIRLFFTKSSDKNPFPRPI